METNMENAKIINKSGSDESLTMFTLTFHKEYPCVRRRVTVCRLDAFLRQAFGARHFLLRAAAAASVVTVVLPFVVG